MDRNMSSQEMDTKKYDFGCNNTLLLLVNITRKTVENKEVSENGDRLLGNYGVQWLVVGKELWWVIGVWEQWWSVIGLREPMVMSNWTQLCSLIDLWEAVINDWSLWTDWSWQNNCSLGLVVKGVWFLGNNGNHWLQPPPKTSISDWSLGIPSHIITTQKQ